MAATGPAGSSAPWIHAGGIQLLLNVPASNHLVHTECSQLAPSVQSQTERACVREGGPTLQVLHTRSRRLKLSTTETQKQKAGGNRKAALQHLCSKGGLGKAQCIVFPLKSLDSPHCIELHGHRSRAATGTAFAPTAEAWAQRCGCSIPAEELVLP